MVASFPGTAEFAEVEACVALPTPPARPRKASRLEGSGRPDRSPDAQETAPTHDGPARNPEAAKASGKRRAHPCLLTGNCDEPTYFKRVEALFVQNTHSTYLRLTTTGN